MFTSSQLLFARLYNDVIYDHLWKDGIGRPVRVALYLASLNFFSWFGLSWFRRRRNHLWMCLSEYPVFLPKLSISPCESDVEHEGSVNGEIWVELDMLFI